METTMVEPSAGVMAGLLAMGAVFFLFVLAITIFMIVCWWRIFSKAGRPGWAAIIPFYNAYIVCKIAGKPGWWLLLFLIPFVNIVIAILVLLGLTQNFGKGGGFAIGLLLLPIIFVPILAFGGAEYCGEAQQ